MLLNTELLPLPPDKPELFARPAPPAPMVKVMLAPGVTENDAEVW
jgi:hypothetical protein